MIVCLAPSGCQPTTVFINPDSSELGALTGVSYAVSYQLDDGVTSGEMQTAVFHIEPYDHENIATYSRLLEAHQLYGDMSRSDELKRLNPALQNPAALQAGTELTTYAR